MQAISSNKFFNRGLIFVFLIPSLMFSGCGKKPKARLTEYVDPFIGTDGHGHTFPGATLPFGMVQLSPDTRKDSWDGCSGYHYSDSAILGFSHTHLSGTGVGDYGDIRFMPVSGSPRWYPDDSHDSVSNYSSRFCHANETASPGYYSVLLEDDQIFSEFTVSDRAGFHRYDFPRGKEATIMIDLVESVTSDRLIDAWLEIESDHEIIGLRRTDGWADDQYVFFYAIFSEPFIKSGFWNSGNVENDGKRTEGDSLKAYVSFGSSTGEPIMVKVGISAVSAESAKNNVEDEIPGWNFNKVRKQAQNKWERELSKASIEDPSESHKRIFYTALYHAFIAPNLYTDANGQYRGHDGRVHKAENGEIYTVFSLWDTYRAAHPLFTLLQPERNVDFINSMLDIYEKGGLLPVWELAGNETDCMIGYHAVSVIADAYFKGLEGFDTNQALEAMVSSAKSGKFGLDAYTRQGYIPADAEGESVSKTLEYAYDDWCIARMAKAMEKDDLYVEFIRRAQYYKNLFDPESGFFRGKMNGMFVTPFDPSEVNFTLTEANTWQYNFYVPHDIEGLISLYGSESAFEDKLDEMFTATSSLTGREQADITGLIGQYAHGNEPSHHMAYLYNFVGKPSKTQDVVRRIMEELYTDQPDGLCGNEDCGQMSAWYVLSSLGIYPVTPGTEDYAIGFPLFDKVTLRIGDERFKISCLGKNDDQYYIQRMRLNDQPYDFSYIRHSDIVSGGHLVFEMGPRPGEKWGREPLSRPVTGITDELITPVPYFKAPGKTFKDKISVYLMDVNGVADIYYSFQSRSPSRRNGKLFKDTIRLKNTLAIHARAYSDEALPSKTASAQFLKLKHDYRVSIKYPYSSQYTAGGNLALVDMIKGGTNFRTGAWQGYQGVDLDVVIDLGRVVPINEISVRFLEDQNAWIFLPREVVFEVSKRPYDYKTIAIITNDSPERTYEPEIKEFSRDYLRLKGRYVKVKARNIGTCPPWHKGAGGKAWIFADEIEIR